MFRFLILAASAAAGLAGLAVQAYRFRTEPDGAAVYAVAFLATLTIVVIQLALARRRASGGREETSVAAIGALMALALIPATPLLTPPSAAPAAPLIVRAPVREEPVEIYPTLPEAPPPVIVVEKPAPPPEPPPVPPVKEDEKAPAAVVAVEPPPAPPMPEPAPLPMQQPVAMRQLPEAAPEPTAPPADPPPTMIVGLSSEGQETPKGWADLSVPFRSTLDPAEFLFLRLGVPSESDPSRLPPMHIEPAFLMLAVSGHLAMSGPAGGFALPMSSVQDTDGFQPGFGIDAEFPLSVRDAIKVSAISIHLRDDGSLREGIPTGALADDFNFEMQWGHLFAGFSHRFAGYTKESRFDFAVHAGAVLDFIHSRVSSTLGQSETPDRESGWSAPAIGVTFAFWSATSGGLMLDIVQTIPINIGGQTVMLTDLRTGIQYDISPSVSFFLGYRRVMATYRTYEDPVRREDGETSAIVDAGGPQLSFEWRF